MKTFYIAICLLVASFSAEAQIDRTNFRAGVNAGLVVGDFSEAYSLTLGVDIYQHWGVSKELDLGIATGFSNAFGEKESSSVGGVTVQTEFDNAQFIPVAGSLRIYPTSGFKIGADVGYAIGLNEGNDGGFYYRPSMGVDVSGGSTEINVSYFAVNGDVNFSTVLLGFLILF
ncbi:hypothetical protein EJ994_02170 [Maribacter sp. MJ134]|uniref:hypothetical protein n=1 Tax=Maribacter sp. MJ134 TaxID=2496865 RepID=UPI000F83EC93|nr:hypothetical protein [Maribacter sp. MJ134]AZQ57669.1 hypothetical protein EJ994_02170 [Maribacter sp. MJ134]